PDLAERIQVGLLNVLEERDVQIRGYKVRLPLDILLVASANPEDYTNRGRLITPLKDRFGSQVRTHYPLDVETEEAIILQEARPFDAPGMTVKVPEFMVDVIATLSQLARQSPHISQRSGVSVRLSVSNYEVMVANAARRALMHEEADVVPRICDLEALPASTAGKVEIETLEEGREPQILDHLVRSAILTVFRERVAQEGLVKVISSVEEEGPVDIGEDIPVATYTELAEDMPALAQAASALCDGDDAPASQASAIEFILEGLHLAKRLNKDSIGGRAQYRARR
ncbi:MAG: magnesium chelatase, partial [Microthrixaceae bacterium]|nr:magnesium chelatase [Microthrixaceae bacterium]